MTERCLEPGEVAAALEAPPGDPRRRHLEGCSRCRALAHTWRGFCAPEPPADAGALAAADAELAARLERATGLAAPAADTAAAGRGGAGPGPARRRSLYALAAALVLCAGLYAAREVALLRDARLPEGPGELRGGPAVSDAAAWARDGDRLVWRAPADADAAVVVLFDADMREVARRPAGAAGSLAPGALALPRPAAFAQVLFLAGGDTVGRSRIVAPR